MFDSPRLSKISAVTLLLLMASSAGAEDGYRLWLRYDPLPAPIAAREQRLIKGALAYGSDPRVLVAAREFNRAVAGLLPVSQTRDGPDKVMLGTAADLRRAGLREIDVSGLGADGYLIRTVALPTGRTIIVTGNSGAGVLYGTFALIREMQLGHPLGDLNLRSAPAYPLRMLDHWDNLDGSVERGYSGRSIWNWAALPGKIDNRYVDYARANASIGINGTVLNNVNADPRILTPEYLKKVAALADVFRPYGIRVFLSVRFSSPIEIGGLKTADPLDPTVAAWWRTKADEVYRLMPDFGGFVVKANSEGQPGPQDYHRTHAEGANVIADALRPHGGTVLWRAFVYGNSSDDRAKQAYEEFHPLDGEFRNNVILQIKNGPIDFQPREPFHPLFGQMPHTRVALEAQITREYLGQNTGVAYLGPMWTEVLDADTCSPKCGTPVSATISAMAGVSSVGSDRNWTGTNFDQANWYAFGRLAWNPHLTGKQIADEWTKLTWSDGPRAVRPIVSIMMGSREAAVNFMTPLGLAHQMATDYHYGPAPWVCDLKQPSWNPCYYNRADAQGIGFDRTKTGSDAVAQYSPPVAARFASLATVPDKYLLWFHHLPWTYRMRSGRTLWDELALHYDLGVAEAAGMSRTWATVRPYVDAERWNAVASDLHREQDEARWWRDASIAYFQSISKLPLPRGAKPPAHSLRYYEALRPPHLPGQRP
ncbi:MAG: alpha-glucuronidase family glycosyl hydrolase [Sphingomicrobium sp.]